MTADGQVRPAVPGDEVVTIIRTAFGAEGDRIPDPAFQVVRLAGYEDWMTGRVVYPDVWWRHDAAGLRDPVLTAVERRLEEQR